MTVDFEYNKQWMPQNTINIKEIGKCAIEAQNPDGFCYYLVVDTSLGETLIATCGPVIPDVYDLPDGFSCSMYHMEYREDKLTKTVSMWLNNKDRKIVEAKEISISEALDQFRDLEGYLRGQIEITDVEGDAKDGDSD